MEVRGRIILGAAAVLLVWGLTSFQENKVRSHKETPQGNAQTLKELDVREIEECRKAAEKGIICPGYQALPQSPVENTTIIIPSPFSVTSNDRRQQ